MIILIKSAIYALITALIIYGAVYFVHSLFIAPFKASRLKKNGNYHQVVAQIENGSHVPYADSDGEYSAVYKYEVDGKTYEKVISRDRFSYLPGAVTLYYDKNPKRTYEHIEQLGRLDNIKRSIFILWLIIFINLFIILMLAK